MLNTSKGPAVWALRAQCDKELYASAMRRVVESQPNLVLREGDGSRHEAGGNSRRRQQRARLEEHLHWLLLLGDDGCCCVLH